MLGGYISTALIILVPYSLTGCLTVLLLVTFSTQPRSDSPNNSY